MKKHILLVQINGLLMLVRPKQWIKNGFVLAPLVFTSQFLNLNSIGRSVLAMMLFCIASSATYILNDMRDIEQDKQHPRKSKTRPLATGMVSLQWVRILLMILYGILILAWFFEPKIMNVIIGYMLLNIAYSFVLKHQPVWDIFTIAIGFVLRVYAGAVALEVPVSGWMFVTTLCLALYLAAIKRRQELEHSGKEGRQVLQKYSIGLVNRYAEMSATAALLFYSLYVMSVKPQLLITIPFVLFGLFRYWYIVETLEGGESPTDALVADWQLALTIVLWIGVCAWTLWPAA